MTEDATVSETATATPDGMVLYTDGGCSDRDGAGWGIHGYTYQNTPLKRGTGHKQVPTADGYQPVSLDATVTPLAYYDHPGAISTEGTNNVAELQGAIEAIRLANATPGIRRLVVLMDSDYVRLGLTKYIHQWIKNQWQTKNGEGVANRTYWETLKALYDAWQADGYQLVIHKVKGHSGLLGNDLADANATLGRRQSASLPSTPVVTPPDSYHNLKPAIEPLLMKSRLLFNVGGETHQDEHGRYYYYNHHLGQQSNYGHKQDDTKSDRHRKTDTLLGRRIADATFCVLQCQEPITYLEWLKEQHTQTLASDVIELAVMRLDTAYKAAHYQRLSVMGGYYLIPDGQVKALLSPGDELFTKTLEPPLLAKEAVSVYTTLERRLREYECGDLGQYVIPIDMTEQFYQHEPPNKQGVVKTKIHPEITNTTTAMELPVELPNQERLTLRMILGIDLPSRNALAKVADPQTRITVLLFKESEQAVSFATIIETASQRAIYQSPYTQFILPPKATKG